MFPPTCTLCASHATWSPATSSLPLCQTLCSILAPRRGGRAYIQGGHIIEQVRYITQRVPSFSSTASLRLWFSDGVAGECRFAPWCLCGAHQEETAHSLPLRQRAHDRHGRIGSLCGCHSTPHSSCKLPCLICGGEKLNFCGIPQLLKLCG